MHHQAASRSLIRTVRQAAFPRMLSRTRLPQSSPVTTPRSQWKFSAANSSLSFHTYASLRASGISADEIMENLNDLYATAKDEFEIAAEGTEENTVYAAEDRDAAKEALTLLKEAFEKATTSSAPEVVKEVQSRVGQRIRELENAVTAMEERAMEE